MLANLEILKIIEDTKKEIMDLIEFSITERMKIKIDQEVKETWTETNKRTNEPLNEPLNEQGKAAVEMIIPSNEQIELMKESVQKIDPKKAIVIEQKFETVQQGDPFIRVTRSNGNYYRIDVQFTKPCEVEFSVSLKKE